MNDTKILDDNAHSTRPASDSIEAYNWYTPKASNQFFEVTNYHQVGLNTHRDTDVKVESQPFTILNASPKKRAKVAHPTTNLTIPPSSKSKGKQKKCLSLLMEMPLDVLYEIFSRLQPRDIINLTRTTRIFRETLLSRSATTVWRAVCDREGAPECPSWMSLPAWVALLFEHVCQSCGARNIRKIDFLLLKRVCLRCKKLHLVNESGVFGRYPETLGHDVSRLLPATNISSWSHKYTSKSKFYWDTDIGDMLRRLSAFRQDIEDGLPNAQKLRDDYMDEQKRRVEYIKEKFGLWNDWHTNKQSARRLACILEHYTSRQAAISSRIFPSVAANPISAPPNPGNSPTESQLRDDPFWCLFSPNDTEDMEVVTEDVRFERDFGGWFNGDIPLAEEDSDLLDRFNRDFAHWCLKTDFDWFDNHGAVLHPSDVS